MRAQPASYRRAILLLSETIDQGSKRTLNEALRLISDTNTAMYSFGFASTRRSFPRGLSEQRQTRTEHGCFSHDGADVEYEGHYSKQVLDASQLAPPMRLATMTFLTARNALRNKTSESIAQLTAASSSTSQCQGPKASLITVSNDLPNYYVLASAQFIDARHNVLHVEAKDRPQLVLKARREYWIDGEPALSRRKPQGAILHSNY